MDKLILTGTALTFAVNVLTWVLRTKVFPRWGKTGVQCIVGSLAVLSALYLRYQEHLAGLTSFMVAALAIFASAVTLYEILWSKVNNKV